MADSKSLKRIKVTVSEETEKDVQMLSESLGMTPAAIRALALRTGIECLKAEAEGAPSSSPQTDSGADDLGARVDALEARVSGFSEVLSGTLSILSWTACKALDEELDRFDNELEEDDGKVS